MTAPSSVERLRKLVREVYGSLEDPNFGRIISAFGQRIHDPLWLSLEERGFDVLDVTDSNTDVASWWEVSRCGGKFDVLLSMVGPFALIMGSPTEGEGVTVIECLKDLRESENGKLLAEVLEAASVEILGREVLTAPIELRLTIADPGRVRLFHALFADVYGLPWDPSA